MDWNEIINTVLPILLTSVVIPAIIIVGGKLSTLIDEKVKDTQVKKYITIAVDCVVDSVEDVAHTFVDKISEGDWTEDKKQLALIQAKEQVLENMGTSGQEILTAALGNFDKWLETKINAEVQRRKLAQGITLTTLVGQTTQTQGDVKEAQK